MMQKNLGFFKIYDVCLHGQGGRMINFRLMSFIDGPCFFDFLPLNLLLVRSYQAEIIIIKHLIQGCNNVYDDGGS